jgi:hypothetical protein
LSIELVDMIDATAANARHIPLTTAKVAGYVTGSGGVPWDASLWSLFPHAGLVRIEQDPPAAYPLHSDVLDVESGAATPDHLPGWVDHRLSAGIKWSTVYGSADHLDACYAALVKQGFSHYIGHVDAWVANWNLNRDEAAALVGKMAHGFTVRAVQWASPTYNPMTVVPGSNLSLQQALVDLSVADASWHPAPSSPNNRPSKVWVIELPKAPGDAPALSALVSTDGGHNYH